MDMLIAVIVLVFSAILHEVMHGFVADKLGDPTARLMGRLTLNPIPHIDPVSSIIIPLMLIFSGSPIIFGAAKPVPVNPLNFRDGRKDMALVALAGPLTNLTLAAVAAIILHNLPFNLSVLNYVILINLTLGFLNLIPIPPLDGSRIFSLVLPDDLARVYYSIEPYGMFILLFLLFFPLGGFSIGNILNQLITFALKIMGV